MSKAVKRLVEGFKEAGIDNNGAGSTKDNKKNGNLVK
jgi:hypothetical protein